MYAEDWELFSRIISSGYKGISIDKCLFYGRKHPNSNTGKYYANNGIRRSSYAEAIVQVVKDLNDKNLLTYSIKRYFIAFSINFKDYQLFEKIMNTLQLDTYEKIQWHIFFKILPIRLALLRIRKSVKSAFNKKVLLVNDLENL
jgi:hypothetical protein